MHPPDKKEAAHAGEQRAADSKNKHEYPAIPSHLTQEKSVLNHALHLAAEGIPVFPCTKDKHPACKHGHKDASSDPAIVRSWPWRSGMLVGVPTGEASGVSVLDIDPKHGGDKWLEEQRQRLPATWVHQTRSGGQHFYFRHHKGLRCSVSKIAAGVDVRASGGYILWWPAAGLPVLNDAPLASWPDWLLVLAMPPVRSFTPPPMSFIGTGDAYARAALRRGAMRVATAPEGCRNDRLNQETWALLRFADAGKLDVHDITKRLAAAAMTAGLPKEEIVRTLASALRARGGV